MSEPKLLHLLHVSHEGVYKAIDKHLKATYGLSSTQHGILFVLEKQGALTTTELSEILAINKSAVSALGDRLVEAGFALRQANPNDRRSAFLALTDRGRDYAKAAIPAVKRFNAALREGFTEREVAVIERFLTEAPARIETELTKCPDCTPEGETHDEHDRDRDGRPALQNHL